MARYRIKLNTVTCHQPRSGGGYHDAVTISIGWRLPSDHPEMIRDAVVSRLGLGHPRYGDTFGPGRTREMRRDDSGWPGTDIDWEYILDLPESGANRILVFKVYNDRFVEDPYVVTRALLAIAAGVGGVVGGSYLPKEGFAAAIGAALKTGAGEVLKEVLGFLFPDWPACAGWVFELDIPLNLHDLPGFVFPAVGESRRIDIVPGGCRQPHYTIQWSAERVHAPTFEAEGRVVRTTYRPVPFPGGHRWVGSWSETGSAPFVGLNIGWHRPPPGTPSRYTLRWQETVPRGGSRRSLVDTVLEGIEESDRRFLPYHGNSTPARGLALVDGRGFEYRPNPVVNPGGGGSHGRETQQEADRPGGTGRPTTGRSLSGMMRADRNTTAGRVLRRLDSRSVQGAATRTLKPLDLRSLSAREGTEVAVASVLMEPGASIHLPEHGLLLRLYTVEETLEDGSVRMLPGEIIRYMRSTNPAATEADLPLRRYAEVR